MEINESSGINGIHNPQRQKKEQDVKHDNTYVGESVTMDTANPADMLGRSMVTKRNNENSSDVQEVADEIATEAFGQKISKKFDIAKSYMGKAKLFLKTAGPKLLFQLGMLFQERKENETDEQAEIRYIISHSYPKSKKEPQYNILRITTPLNKDLIKRMIQDKRIRVKDIPECFASNNTDGDIKAKEDMYDFAKEHLDWKGHGYIGWYVESSLTSKVIKYTTKATAPFLKRLMVDNKLSNIHSTVSLRDTKEDIQAKNKMYDFLLADNSLDFSNNETCSDIRNLLHDTNAINEAFLKKLYKDNIIPKLKVYRVLKENESNENLQAKLELYNLLSKDPDLNKKRFDLTILTDIIRETNHINKSFIEFLYNDGILDKADIAYAASDINSEEEKNARYEIYKLISKDKNIDSRTFEKILFNTTPFSKPIIEKYYLDNKIKKEDIIDLVYNRHSRETLRYQSEVYDMLTQNSNFDAQEIMKILKHFGENELYRDSKKVIVDFVLKDKNCKSEDFNEFLEILSTIVREEDYKKVKNSFSPQKIALVSTIHCSKTATELSKEEILKNIDNIEKIKQQVLKKANKYVNGTNSEEANKEIIEQFFYINAPALFDLLTTTDKETVDVLLRKRLENAEEYLADLQSLNPNDIELLKKLVASTNIDGKPFMPTQKIEFIDLLKGYQNNKLSTEKIQKMAEKGNVNLAELHIDLFNQIMKNAGLNDEEMAQIPKEKLISWDTKYAHMLAKGINEAQNNDDEEEVDEKGYIDILKAANLYDFETYIDDESNKYGIANAKTKQIFKKMNLNYEKWIHPSKNLEMNFVSTDKNKEQLKQVISQIIEDMNTLMKTPVKGHIKKQFPNFVKGDEFIMPGEFLSSKTKLTEFIKMLTDESENGNMTAVWKRAKGNLKNDNPEKVKSAQSTLTILDHLKQRQQDLENVKTDKTETSVNWKIKMWDRVPQKDLFQGNYSTCCIGIGGGNGHAMPHYLMNRAYNMIELVDNDSGQTMGNALCYFAKSAGKPVFVIDNIEINTSKKPSNKVCLKLRESITEYASKIAKEVTGKENTPIYLGPQYNDVPYKDITPQEKEITFLGELDCDSIYMDMFAKDANWTTKKDFTKKCNILRLK